MNNLRIAQHAYDNASEEELSDYRESHEFAEFCDHVTLELLSARDCQGIVAQIFMIDLELSCGGYQLAIEWVSKRLTERQYRAWIDDYGT